jgi:DNA ligase-1
MDKTKDLVYNIFDIMIDDVPYIERRLEIANLKKQCEYGNDVRFLPILETCNFDDLETVSSRILHLVTDMGAEGCMINLASGKYNHKRTDELLKLKKVQTIDMKVYDFDWGNGKYDGMVGALKAVCVTDDGKVIKCDIGSGLSDEQRLEWANDFSKICGKIVEVAYFSLSQTSKDKGSNSYSLRFPRLKSIRKDKVNTSEY